MKLDEFTQLGWGDATDYFHHRDQEYRMAKLKDMVVVRLQPDEVAAAPALKSFRQLMETLDIIPGIFTNAARDISPRKLSYEARIRGTTVSQTCSISTA